MSRSMDRRLPLDHADTMPCMQVCPAVTPAGINDHVINDHVMLQDNVLFVEDKDTPGTHEAIDGERADFPVTTCTYILTMCLLSPDNMICCRSPN